MLAAAALAHVQRLAMFADALDLLRFWVYGFCEKVLLIKKRSSVGSRILAEESIRPGDVRQRGLGRRSSLAVG